MPPPLPPHEISVLISASVEEAALDGHPSADLAGFSDALLRLVTSAMAAGDVEAFALTTFEVYEEVHAYVDTSRVWDDGHGLETSSAAEGIDALSTALTSHFCRHAFACTLNVRSISLPPSAGNGRRLSEAYTMDVTFPRFRDLRAVAAARAPLSDTEHSSAVSALLGAPVTLTTEIAALSAEVRVVSSDADHDPVIIDDALTRTAFAAEVSATFPAADDADLVTFQTAIESDAFAREEVRAVANQNLNQGTGASSSSVVTAALVVVAVGVLGAAAWLYRRRRGAAPGLLSKGSSTAKATAAAAYPSIAADSSTTSELVTDDAETRVRGGPSFGRFGVRKAVPKPAPPSPRPMVLLDVDAPVRVGTPGPSAASNTESNTLRLPV